MSDAVSNAGSALNRIGGPLISGGQMFDEVMEKRFEQREQEAPAEREKTVVPDRTHEEIEGFKSRLEQLDRTNSELRAELARVSGTSQALLAQRERAPQQAEQLPMVELDDPDLVAAFNTLEKRLDHKLQSVARQSQEQNMNHARTIEYSRFKQAIEERIQQSPEFGKLFSTQQLEDFARPYISDPRYHGKVDWRKELDLAYRAATYDTVKSELETAKKQLEEINKKTDRERAQQKRDLAKVPSLGQRAGSGTSGRSVGEEILASHKGKSRMSFRQFGTELRKRIAM